MKLAEALIEKKALAARLNELQARYLAIAVVEEGEVNEEDDTAEGVFTSLQATYEKYERMIVNINQTNNDVLINGVTLMQALARRDVLKSQVHVYNGILSTIRQRNSGRRHYGETVKMVLAEGVVAADIAKMVDTLSQELRVLDVSIQAANWAHDLVA